MKFLFIIFLSITSLLTYSQDSLKITFYILLNFPSSQQDRTDTLKKILKAPKEMNVKKKETSTENSILENIRK